MSWSAFCSDDNGCCFLGMGKRRRGWRAFPAPAVCQLPSAQNDSHAKVPYFVVASFDLLHWIVGYLKKLI